MRRVHVICEGQTEEAFVKHLLIPHFSPQDIHLLPSLIGIAGHKGGRVNSERLLGDVCRRLKSDQRAYCTTFFDFYGLPPDFVGKDKSQTYKDVAKKAQDVCHALTDKVEHLVGNDARRRFIPYVQMYEYEALLFSHPQRFAQSISGPDLTREFTTIRNRFSSPEEINDSVQTAPSKRIISLVSGYEKSLHGILAAQEIGLSTIRQECQLFGDWVTRLEQLA